jgi:hypothetical protein
MDSNVAADKINRRKASIRKHPYETTVQHFYKCLSGLGLGVFVLFYFLGMGD